MVPAADRSRVVVARRSIQKVSSYLGAATYIVPIAIAVAQSGAPKGASETCGVKAPEARPPPGMKGPKCNRRTSRAPLTCSLYDLVFCRDFATDLTMPRLLLKDKQFNWTNVPA
jgi:hypothetical protein